MPITKQTKKVLADFPGAEDSNGVLTYGYYDTIAVHTLQYFDKSYVGICIKEDKNVYANNANNKIYFEKMKNIENYEIE